MNLSLKRIFLVCIASLLPASSVLACTLFGAQGSRVLGGGTLVVKNRDFRPEYQEMRLVQGSRYRFYGLYGGTDEKMGLKGGVNEAGLVVFSAAASCIPQKERRTMGKNTGSLGKLLGRYATVEEALESGIDLGGPKFLLLADATELAWVEVGTEDRVTVRRVQNGTLAHTNFYLSPEFESLNLKPAVSARHRYARIEELLESRNVPYILDDLIGYSTDQTEGADNSLWRTGSRSEGPQTLATFGVWIHAGARPDVFVKIRYSPEDQGKEDVYQLDGAHLFPEESQESGPKP
jgi:hypothetical protein